MNATELARLYERIVAQREYAGGVCPSEATLVEYTAGRLSAAEAGRLREHLKACRECEVLAEDVLASGDWFAENRAEILAGLVDKAIAARLRPWDACPSKAELRAFVTGSVLEGQRGVLFRNRLREHVADCETCGGFVATLESQRSRGLTVTLQQLVDRVREAVQAVSELLRAFEMIVPARGAGYVRAMPGYRSQTAPVLPAVLVDATGCLVLGDDGLPRCVKFDVIRAEVERDGHAVLDFSTSDSSVWARADQAFALTASLEHGNVRLVLPPQRIGANGRATVVADLTDGVELRELPLSAISLTVTEAGGQEAGG